MKINLRPDKDISVEKLRIGNVPTLILRPANMTQNGIGLLWIHGGGYILGMKEMVYMSRAADLVKKYGVTVFSPGYRLAFLKPYPAALQDCYSVLRYMDDNRDSLKISSVMVGGESAGGGLCAAVCMMARDNGILVDYQFPLYPMLSNVDTDSSRDNHGKIWNTRRNHLGWKLYLRKDAEKAVSAYAAPANQTDYHDLPPCYTFVGDGEPFYSETLKYVEDLRNAGVPAEVDVYHTNTHAFDMLYPDRRTSREAIANFESQFENAMKAVEKMKKEQINNICRISRIEEMEKRMNRVISWIRNPDGDVSEDVRLLEEYYQNGLWKSDFEADEAGQLPADLIRGVLSEDGLYNVLEEYHVQYSVLR